ncbi:MAG: peptidylprolyl isomerase [Cyanobacteria bacterium J06623_5]
MNTAIQIGPKSIDTPTLVEKLLQYRLLEKFVREDITDDLIADVVCDPAIAYAQFCQRRQLTTEQQRDDWCKKEHFSLAQMKAEAVREYRLQQFKEETWGDRLQSYFLQRKKQLDRVIYSLIRVKEASLAQELFFRLRDDGVEFSELAKCHSAGKESQTGGLVGPVELSVPHPTLARMLELSHHGQLWEPTKIGDWYIIVRFEKCIPAQLDEVMRQRLLHEQFQVLLQERLQASPIKLLPQPDSLSEQQVEKSKQQTLSTAQTEAAAVHA